MFLSSYIGTRVEVWENERCCGNTSRRRVFPQLFRVLPNFHECLYNSIETRSICFLFLLENTATRKRKITCSLWLSKCKFSLIALSLRQQLVLVMCLHWVLYNNLSYYRILIGSRLWSIRGQTHDWRHHYIIKMYVYVKKMYT